MRTMPIVLLLAAVGASAAVAHACGMLLAPPRQLPQAIARNADRLLQAGADAASELAHDDLRATYPDQSDLPDAHFRILADAIVRGGEQREENLRWAVQVLEQLAAGERAKRKSAHPRTLTALGLGLSQLLDRQDEAKRVLEDLAKRDLITSPQGHAALARLRERDGDVHGAQKARARCRLMLEKPDEVCGPEVDSLASIG